MDPLVAKLLWLIFLIGIFSGVAIMLLRVDRSEEWKRARIAQLIINKHGGLDIAAVALWAAMAFNMLVIIFVLFHGSMPEGLSGLMTAFNLTFGAPMVTKILKGSADGSAAQPEEVKP